MFTETTPGSLSSASFRIERIEARILDLPVRTNKLAFGLVTHQSPVIVQLWLSDGAFGFGEATTFGGLSWSEESPETILQIINDCLGLALLGKAAGSIEYLLQRMDAVCKGNYLAKSAVEMAAIDAVSRQYNMPASQLLGGQLRDALPLVWTLASGNAAKDVKEAERMLGARRHRTFKVMIGQRAPADDVEHVSRIAHFLDGRASMSVDINQAWDRNTARRFVPQLIDAGVTLIEQPVAKSNIEAMRQLAADLSNEAMLVADEAVCSPQDAMNLARQNACHVFSLKVAKHGGLLRTRAVAAVGHAAEIDWHGGSMFETSLGSAAAAHVFATLPGKHSTCELIGPQLLAEDIVESSMVVRDFELQIPTGPGFGVQVLPEMLERFDRKKEGLIAVHVDMGRSSATEDPSQLLQN